MITSDGFPAWILCHPLTVGSVKRFPTFRAYKFKRSRFNRFRGIVNPFRVYLHYVIFYVKNLPMIARLAFYHVESLVRLLELGVNPYRRKSRRAPTSEKTITGWLH